VSDESSLRFSKTTSTLNLILGLWFFLCPWVFGFSRHPNNPWSYWLTGAGIVIVALIQLSDIAVFRFLGFLEAMIGVLVFVSPWVFGYAGIADRFVNSLCVGAVVLVLGLSSAHGVGHPGAHHPAPAA